ncbi:MAG: amidase [Proteobacteria bacterium]|nr:amidase [Pseudomonadota bacterium]
MRKRLPRIIGKPAVLLITLLMGQGCSPPRAIETVPLIDVSVLTVTDLRSGLDSGWYSATDLTRAYLDRIKRIDDAGPQLNAIIEINPDAMAIAAQLDAQFAAGGPRGSLHGLPVVLKANIDTADGMATSAGSLALATHQAAIDAFVVSRLRAAGAIILGKANLSEWANFRDEHSSSGWSSVGGQTKNPFVLDRNPCGSSSGSAVAVAASLAPLAVGTETSGSIVCPAGTNGVVGIKPTVGVISRSGIIPISHSQDTAGPMAKTVTGAALLLEAMIGFDPSDAGAVEFADGASLLPDPAGVRLDGIRIGVLRGYYGSGRFPQVDAIYEANIAVLAGLGATAIDPIEYRASDTQRAAQYQVLLYEFKAGLNAYLESHSVADEVDSLADLIIYNNANQPRVMPHFAQNIFIDAQATDGLEGAAYLQAREDANQRLRDDVDALFVAQKLDAILLPVNGPAWPIDWLSGDNYGFGGTAYLAAVTGYPSIVVPAGNVSGLPIAVGFLGRAFTERNIIQMAYAFEQATRARIDPMFVETLETTTPSPGTR